MSRSVRASDAGIALGLLLLGGASAYLLTAGPGLVRPLVVAGAGGLAGVGLVAGRTGDVRFARRILWVGSIGPLMYSMVGADATEAVDTSLGVDAIIRGGLPILTLALALIVATPERRPLGAPEGWLLAFLTFAGASSLWSSDPRATFLKALALSASFANLAYLARLYGSLSEAVRGLVTFVHVLLVWVAVQAVAVPFLVFRPGSSGIARLSSAVPSIHPNQLSHLALLGVLSVIFGVVPPRLARDARLRHGLLVVYVAEILATRSRFVLVVGSVVVVLALLRRTRHSVGAGLTVCVLAATALLGVFTAGAQAEEFFRRGQSERAFQTMSGRTLTWESGLEMASERPLFGRGYYAGHRLDFTDATGSRNSNLDNVWVETLVNLGYTGTALLGLFVASGVLYAVRRTEFLPAGEQMFLQFGTVYFAAATFINPSVQANNMGQVILGALLIFVSVHARKHSVGDGRINRLGFTSLSGMDRSDAHRERRTVVPDRHSS